MSDRELLTVEKLFKVNILIRKHLHQHLAEREVYPGQPPILKIIDSSACSQRRLQRVMISPASVAVSIRRMQSSGLIEKLTDEKDLRFNKIRLTEKGKEAHRYCRSQLERLSKIMTEGFDEADTKAFDCVINKMIDNLSKDE